METEALSGLERFAQTFLNWEVLVKYAPSILAGVGVTVWLSVLIILVGMTLGTLLACLRAYRVGPLSFLIVVFADVFRALPPLVVILLVFFGLPNAGIYLSAFMVLFVVLTLILAAFAEEILWAGITSVDKGQWEAARSTGLGFTQTLGYVILPQAMRLAIPPLTNRAIAITKMTALGTVIGVPDILNQATTAQSFSGNASPLLLAALAYVLLFLPFVILSRWLERRYSWKKA
ncbi:MULTISPECIES: amino acid ABC transporter permease [Roseovarius]|jgi:polar amino acid transport system permease protein|uniref:Polar amino acid ABC transporter permease n=1 Tax=Roseovarius nubinhibens TaxID=314263 RepID=A0A348WFE3_9RHOB|nr:amino acid ABC transporter permease [Roseovarius sp.]MAZ22968.1 polar amino acid ABC transporter permease [Roseovarius sp.]HAR53255.1 polar amino acid ABC transporter permease [Roseovarius nubinhibens]|tara:strand:+ start:2306 stop:3004 length:699 start_codon:yes stop_codon:yes gene_type:complete